MNRNELETLETRNMMSATAGVTELVGPQQSAAIVMQLDTAATTTASLTAAQKHRVEQITSTFENSTTVLQYDFIANEQDGRGYTAGRAGFCTGTGDFLEVVQRYTNVKPSNGLTKYLPRLRQLAASGSDSTSNLSGIEAAWKTAAADQTFRDAQDAVVDQYYYNPALAHAQTAGLKSVLALGQMYDAIIQHGDGEDHDGLSAMIDRTNAMSGGSPAQGVNERTWIGNFLTVRRATLMNATDPATRDGWRNAVSRVDAYIGFWNAGNMSLSGELNWTVYGDHFSLPSDATTTITTATATISGQVFFDGDMDGVYNGFNGGSGGREVFIDTDNDGWCDQDEIHTTTDEAGNYAFSGLAAGTYNVTLSTVSWTFSTTPVKQATTVAAGQTADNVNFGEWVTYRQAAI